MVKLLLGGFILFALAAGCYYLYYNSTANDRLYRSFSSIKGTLIEFAIVEKAISMRTGGTTSRTVSAPAWVIEATYKYKVDDTEYTGTRVYSNNAHVHRKKVDDDPMPEQFVELQQQLKPGMAIDIYYNPNNPEHSFLKYQDNQDAATVMLWASIGFAAMGILLLVLAFRMGTVGAPIRP